MRRYRSLIRRLWRNAPPEPIKIRVRWIDGETTIIDGYKIPGYELEENQEDESDGRTTSEDKPSSDRDRDR